MEVLTSLVVFVVVDISMMGYIAIGVDESSLKDELLWMKLKLSDAEFVFCIDSSIS